MQIKPQYTDIKRATLPDVFDENEILALIERVAGRAYADRVRLSPIASDGFDEYRVSDTDGGILIEATSGVTAAYAFNQYLKHRCGYSVGILSTSGELPAVPPAVGEPLAKKSRFLYRYFFNYCTFSYTYAFDTWEDWERTLDYLLLSGYNLVLNPIGIESIWRRVLLRLGYTEAEADGFLAGPAYYAWQWMMNLSGWMSGAPAHWYDERLELAGKFNTRLEAFGVGIVAAGYVGMVPDDFPAHYPDSELIDQGKWFGYHRPAFILPWDKNFEKVADLYYEESRRIAGADKIAYFSADPFHEGGISDGIDLHAFATACYGRMCREHEGAVWVIQGWSPLRPDILKAIPDGNLLVVNLRGSATEEKPGLFEGAPWCYCDVFTFGGQYNYQSNAEATLLLPHKRLDDEVSNITGIGYMPEGVNCNEIIYEIISENAFGDGYASLEDFVRFYIATKYGVSDEGLVSAWCELCRRVMDGRQLISGESALCARAALDTVHTSRWSAIPNPFVDQTPLLDYIRTMLAHYDALSGRAAYRKDLLEAARQAVSNLSWYYVEMLRRSYAAKDMEGVSAYGAGLLSLYDLQVAIVGTDKDMLLGTWLEKAKRLGKTPAERTYFEWNARTQITLWAGEEASEYFHDYAAREWQGLLEDFYRPRWEIFISRLELSLLTGKELPAVKHYHEEAPFLYRKTAYPTAPSGDLYEAVTAALRHIESVKIEAVAAGEAQASFAENVFADLEGAE